MKYYKVTVYMPITDETYNGWDTSCDETFHGPGSIHDGSHIYVTDYTQVTKEEFNKNKYNLFTEEGGI